MNRHTLVVCRDETIRRAVVDALSGGETAVTAPDCLDVTGRQTYDCVVFAAGPTATPASLEQDIDSLAERVGAPILFVGEHEPGLSLVGGPVADIVRLDHEGWRTLLSSRVDRLGPDAPRARADGGVETVPVEQPLERMAESFLAVDREGAVTLVNENAGQLLGVDSEAVLGTPLEEAVPGSELTSTCQDALETGTETAIDGYDEALESWIEGTAYPDEDGIAVFFRDVSRQRELRQELQENEAALERLHDIAADPGRSVDEKIDQLLQVGADRLGTEYGFLTHIEDGVQEVIRGVGGNPQLEPGATAPLSEAYCRHTIGRDEPLSVSDAPQEDWEEDPAYQRFGLDCYLGATIHVDNEEYGTVCFADTEPREDPFTERAYTFAELLTDWIHYLLEQQDYEREIKAEQAFTESLINSLADPLYAFDETGQLIRWNSRVEEVTGYEPSELEEATVSEFIAEADQQRVVESLERVLDGERTSVEATMVTSDDRQIPYEFSGAPLRDETDTIIGSVGIGRDITDRLAQQERLSGLLETTRSLMQARDREHVAEIAVGAARELLGFETSVFRIYDSDTETLEPTAATDAARELLGDRPVYEVGSGHPGEVFASGESRIVPEMDDEEVGPIESAMYYPVGVHGTISVGSTERDSFDDTDEQMLALLSTTAAAACMRAKREQEVREAREHTERVLDRVNGLIENTIEVLVQATTREEIEEGVVNELAASEPYTFAWIGQPDVASETLSPTAWGGEAGLSIQGRSFPLDRQGEPVSDAYREGRPQVLADVDSNQFGPWADIASDTDVEAVLVVPLTYKDAAYGVLAVSAEDPAALDERERIVLEALGRAVANAINAVERGRILDATEIIELEFAVDDRELLFSRLSASGECRVESAGTEYRSDGSVRLYLSVTDVDPEAFLELAHQDAEIQSVTAIVEHETECLVEIVVDESVLATLTEYGAVPQSVVAEGGTTRFTVELPYEAEARELFELVEDQYPGTDLLGYHERERAMETRQDFKSALSDRLTDRQETALRTAYLGGFFDWPREVDGNELAEAMDISRPTYHQHLRAAQGKVFEELFD